ncbi:MAG TPA: VOC family protein [Planctomycetota bacterium]|jgi:predicted enzyme related to lactoylglutathione lyase|nr:VOC family protein [Planctomycetota bacterium]
MSRVIHFEIHAEDPPRAIAFYSKLFEWEFKKWDGPQEYWVIQTGSKKEPGIDGGLVRRRGPIDGQAVIAFVCTVDVKSVDNAISAILTLGGTIVVDKMSVPGVGWLVYARDTEGNIFGVLETAKPSQ